MGYHPWVTQSWTQLKHSPTPMEMGMHTIRSGLLEADWAVRRQDGESLTSDTSSPPTPVHIPLQEQLQASMMKAS